jgi:hypothetical protein
MECAAVTQVLAHFVSTKVGGNNAKAVFEAGMTAARDGVDLGTNGVKWLASATAAGPVKLPGTIETASRILGGLQFSSSFSSAAEIQFEGCPTYPKTVCEGLTPEQSLKNVLQLSYFVGTVEGPIFGALTDVYFSHFNYVDAPMNYLEIYDTDIQYALGLSGCSMLKITGNPANKIAPNVSKCEAQPSSTPYVNAQETQEGLNLASLSLQLIAEPVAPW